MNKKDLTSLNPQVLGEIDNLKHLFFLSDYATLGVFLRFSGYKFPEGVDPAIFEGWNAEKKDFLERQKKQYDALQSTYVDNLNTRLAFANKLMGLLERHVNQTHSLDMDGAEITKVARAFAQIAAVQDQTIVSMNISPTLDGEYEQTKEKIGEILNAEVAEINSEEEAYNEEVDAMLLRNAELLKLRTQATPVYSETKQPKPDVVVKEINPTKLDGNA
jgi:hypothetical protein